MSPKKIRKNSSKLFLTDRALSDFIDIKTYSISNWGKDIASKYILKFEKAFRLLEENPELLRPNPDLGSDLLFYRVEKHLIVCVKIKEYITVLTVAHANRDL